MLRRAGMAGFFSVNQISGWISSSRLRAYSFAIVTTGIAFAIRFVLDPELNTRPIFSLFAFAVLVTAVFAGTGPALLATALSVIAVDGYIFRPNSVRAFAYRDFVEDIVFVATATGMIGLNQIVFRARGKMED